MTTPGPRRRVLSLLGLACLTATALSGCGGTVQDLEVGDCLDQGELEGEQVSRVTAIDCADPHDAEVYAELGLPDGDYPGTEQVREKLEEHCTAAFEEFIGVPYTASELYYSYLAPTEEGWSGAGDRTGLCIALTDEEMTGSLAGAER